MDLETRIARLEAAESIRILKAHYCDLCDTGYDVEALGSLFVEDATWDGGNLGTFEGLDAIKRFFGHMPKVLRFAIHHVTNSAVDVADDALSATGTWYLLQSATTAASNEAVWIAGRYQDEFVKVGDSWRFARITIETKLFTPSGAGWADEPFIQVGS
ncbi:MAG: nuclear transport factor 2 family protein [Acidimicrobiales bacterium]